MRRNEPDLICWLAVRQDCRGGVRRHDCVLVNMAAAVSQGQSEDFRDFPPILAISDRANPLISPARRR